MLISKYKCSGYANVYCCQFGLTFACTSYLKILLQKPGIVFSAVVRNCWGATSCSYQLCFNITMKIKIMLYGIAGTNIAGKTN